MVCKYTQTFDYLRPNLTGKIKVVSPEEFYRIRQERMKQYRLDEDPLALPLSVRLGTNVMTSREVRKLFLAGTIKNVRPYRR